MTPARVTAGWHNGSPVKRYTQVPELLLGFDTETTGLSVTSERAIAYGFIAYRFGVPFWDEHYYVIPDRPITSGAQRVHGLTLEDIEAKRASEAVYPLPAGLVRAIEVLGDFHRRGAYIVGSNVSRFDLEMLRRSSISVLGRALDDEELDLSLLRIIDVVEHDLAIEPSREARPRRGLEHLCRHYGVRPGGHDALGDARAAVEVFLEQVIANNSGQTSLALSTDTNSYFDSLQR